MEKKVKKERSGNFNQKEIKLLLRLALNYKNILENGQTNSAVDKTAVWRKISNEFNSISVYGFRGENNLKNKYKNLKRDLRKQKSSERQQVMATGGDALTPKAKLNESEEMMQLEETIALSIHGCRALFDEDEVMKETVNENDRDETLKEDQILISDIKNTMTFLNDFGTDEIVTSNTLSDKTAINVNTQMHNDAKKTTSVAAGDAPKTKNTEVVECVASTLPPSTKAKWDKMSGSLLRAPINPAPKISKGRNPFSSKSTNDAKRNIDYEKQYFEAELHMAKERHKLQCEISSDERAKIAIECQNLLAIRKQKENEHLIRMQILRAQLKKTIESSSAANSKDYDADSTE